MVERGVEGARRIRRSCRYARKTEATAKRVPRIPNVIVWIVLEDDGFDWKVVMGLEGVANG